MSEPAPSRTLIGDAIMSDMLVRELLEARLVGVLATLERDGSAHAVPLWLAAEDGAILLATGSASRKVRNLERDPRATLVVHDSRAGCEVCGVSMRGRVEILRGAGAASLVRHVHERYIASAELDRDEVRSFLGGDDTALRFIPDKAVTWDERASAAATALRASGGWLPLEPTTPRGLS